MCLFVYVNTQKSENYLSFVANERFAWLLMSILPIRRLWYMYTVELKPNECECKSGENLRIMPACARTHLVHSWAWNFLRNYCSVSVAGIRPLCFALRRLFRDTYAYFARWMGKTHQTVEEMQRIWRLLPIFKKAKRRETTRNDLLILIIMLSNNQNCIKFKLKMRAHWILNLN